LTVLIALPLFAAQQKPQARSDAAAHGMSYTGCLRATRAAPENPDDRRVVYTLEILPPAPAQGTTATSGSSGTKSEKPEAIQLSADPAKNLSRHVGKKIQVTGELLQPPGLPPGAADPDRPLPRNSEATFRVASVNLLGEKCPN
jgi:hypothetical protein